MKVSFGTVNGDQWEEYSHKVLRIKYQAEDYIKVPAKYGGDLGIESFTKAGKVFQCYCPDGEPSSDELYTKQRTKITRDINKLVKNAAELVAILGSTKINKWYLVTPRYENKELIAHCQKKSDEVKAKHCSHVDTHFDVLILTEEDFVIENGALIAVGAHQITVEPPDKTTTDVIDWKTAENDLYDNIQRKISKIPNVRDVDKYVEFNVKEYLAGQDMLRKLHQDYPNIYEKLLSIKNAQEHKVERFSMTPTEEPSKFLVNCFKEYELLVKENLGNAMSASTITHLTGEAIADWLIRCPLDF
jgi:hypothetical protein